MVAQVGRYRDVARAGMPGDLPREGKRRSHIQIKHGAVADPNPACEGKRQRVAINVNTDAIEREYANGRLSEAGYWAGRTYGRVLERSRPGAAGGSLWDLGDRVDHTSSHELAILGRISRAQDAVAMIAETAPVLGLRAQRLLELVLVEGLAIGIAGERICGGRSRQDVIFWATLFRNACEDLADFWCSGRRRAPRA